MFTKQSMLTIYRYSYVIMMEFPYVKLKTTLLHLIVVWVLTYSALVFATNEVIPTETLQRYNTQLENAEKFLKQPLDNPKQLGDLQNEAIQLGLEAQNCITTYETKQAKTKQDLDSLGKATPEEDIEVKNKRKQLETEQQQIEKSLSQCRLLNLRAKTVENNAHLILQKLTTEQLLASSASILTYQLNLLRQTDQWQIETKAIVKTFLNPPINWHNLFIAIGYGITGLLVGFIWSTHKRRYYRLQHPAIQSTSPTLSVIWRSLIKTLPYALMTGLAALSLTVAPAGIPEILTLFITLLSFSLSYAILRALLRTPTKLDGIDPVDNQTGKQIYFWARLLFFTTIIGIIFQWPALNNIDVLHATNLSIDTNSALVDASKDFNSTPSITKPPNLNTLTTNNLVGLIRIACGTLIGFTLMRLVWLMAGHFSLLRKARLHVGASLALLVAIGSLWLGYRNFSLYLFTGVFGSLFLTLLAWLLLHIPSEIFDGLDEGRAIWQQSFRQHLGLKPNQLVPGLLWIRLTYSLVVSGLISIAILRLWGMSEQTMLIMLNQVINGFNIGGLKLEPLRLLGGILLVVLLISFTQVFKQHLAETWLKRTTLSKGAREATTIISGYIIVLIAILLGLSIAGIEFKNLAIIAGALSVGIGFGLQNIVNNFVSGLILLFERPIRKGDWIKVGNAEGYVREISIRSTTIQTFDRSDIIVPNSEIISGQVINMMLNDNYGRIIIAIGVSYGSDTEKVMKLLREVAMEHPLVIKDRNDMKINIFFRGFGDNALNFELSCFVREIETKSAVTSDLNLAIDKRFRDQGIEVPFPQRTVHIVAKDATSVDQSTETSTKPTNLS